MKPADNPFVRKLELVAAPDRPGLSWKGGLLPAWGLVLLSAVRRAPDSESDFLNPKFNFADELGERDPKGQQHVMASPSMGNPSMGGPHRTGPMSRKQAAIEPAVRIVDGDVVLGFDGFARHTHADILWATSRSKVTSLPEPIPSSCRRHR